MLPLESSTVRVTLLIPISLQSKLDWLNEIDWIAQLSVLPLLTAATVVDTVEPTNDKLRLPGIHKATGSTVSKTDTCTVQLSRLPL